MADDALKRESRLYQLAVTVSCRARRKALTVKSEMGTRKVPTIGEYQSDEDLAERVLELSALATRTRVNQGSWVKAPPAKRGDSGLSPSAGAGGSALIRRFRQAFCTALQLHYSQLHDSQFHDSAFICTVATRLHRNQIWRAHED